MDILLNISDMIFLIFDLLIQNINGCIGIGQILIAFIRLFQRILISIAAGLKGKLCLLGGLFQVLRVKGNQFFPDADRLSLFHIALTDICSHR